MEKVRFSLSAYELAFAHVSACGGRMPTIIKAGIGLSTKVQVLFPASHRRSATTKAKTPPGQDSGAITAIGRAAYARLAQIE